MIPESEASVILKAAPIRYASQNIFYRYQQDSNFLYLCAWNEPDTTIVLEKSKGGTRKFMMFLSEQSEESKLWEGERNGSTLAKEFFGADVVYDVKELEEYKKSCKQKIYEEPNASAFIHQLRVVKSPSEVALMRRAAQIACEAFSEIRPHALVEENAVEAQYEYECRRRGAQGLSYVPVIAGGPRGLIIHYTRNDQKLNPKEGVLMDAGCRYHGYCSDVTRSFAPTVENGGWQKIYDVVEKVQRLCLEVLGYPGEHRTLMSLNALANHLFEEELRLLGFPEGSAHELFPHSIGHYLGMDVHDCPSVSIEEELKAGMVVTVEPGLYIPRDSRYPKQYWDAAVRIEDDILVTEDGIEVLSKQM